ncbi:MAG: MFS transporter, partial [Chloroflexi bacterium]|nr:MFS transporter [Chloroflexota bacterium]
LSGVFVYQSLLALGFGTMVLLGDVNAWHVFSFVFMMGIGWVIVDPARMALIPAIVPRHSLVNAFALNSLAFSITRLAIPAIGGALIVFSGAGVALLLQGGLVAVAAALALGLGTFATSGQPKLNARGALSEILEGVRYIRDTPVVLGLMLFGFLPTVLISPFLHGLIPVYAAEVYDVGPATLGLLMSAVGAGFLTGTLLLASIGDVPHKGLMILGCIALICVSMVAFALNPSIALAFPIVAIGSMGTMGYFSITGATMQSILPDGIRGRVSGIYILTFGAMPAGNLAAGVISENMGAPTATLIACGLVVVAASVLMLLFPSIRKL